MKLLDIDEIGEHALHQIYLPLKEGGCGFSTHSPLDLCKFYVSSALLIAPFVREATGLQLGTDLEPHAVVRAQVYDSEHCLANSANLLVGAGTPQANFALAGPAESAAFLDNVSRILRSASRTSLENAFVANHDDASRARLRSASGVGAQWLACLPTCPKLCLDDDDFRLAVRFRLGLDTFTSGICPHVNADGIRCGQFVDRAGWHFFACPSGGGWYMSHDTIVATFCCLVAGPDGRCAMNPWHPRCQG